MDDGRGAVKLEARGNQLEQPVPGSAGLRPAAMVRGLNGLRAVCLGLSALAIMLFVLGLPLYYRQLQVTCAAPPCYVSPTVEQVQALQTGGISPTLAAAYQVSIITFFALVNVLVAA